MRCLRHRPSQSNLIHNQQNNSEHNSPITASYTFTGNTALKQTGLWRTTDRNNSPNGIITETPPISPSDHLNKISKRQTSNKTFPEQQLPQSQPHSAQHPSAAGPRTQKTQDRAHRTQDSAGYARLPHQTSL